MSARPLFEKLREALEATGMPYMVTGSFASAAHGVPRATHDIDVVVAPEGRLELLALLRQFPGSEYYAEPEDAIQAFTHRTQFNVIAHHSIWKVDFFLRKDRPFSRAEFERRRPADFLGVTLFAVTPEDLVIAKLESAKRGEIEQHLLDAAGIIAIQGELDTAYIERWVADLDLDEQWRRAREQASS